MKPVFNKFDIITSSIRPQFEIDRFKNIKKNNSNKSLRQKVISST